MLIIPLDKIPIKLYANPDLAISPELTWIIARFEERAEPNDSLGKYESLSCIDSRRGQCFISFYGVFEYSLGCLPNDKLRIEIHVTVGNLLFRYPFN